MECCQQNILGRCTCRGIREANEQKKLDHNMVAVKVASPTQVLEMFWVLLHCSKWRQVKLELYIPTSTPH
jgi:hypothetical protein